MSQTLRVRAAVVGHVEWVLFARVDRVPEAGAIVHATDMWELPGGGGSGAAAQLAKLAGEVTFFTALGNDELGARAHDELTRLGIRVEAARRPEPTRRAFTHVDGDGERTITVFGKRLEPRGEDDLPWDELEDADAVYFTAGDVEALHRARRARVLVATSRVLHRLREGSVPLDALVGSALDDSESYVTGDLDPAPAVLVRTEGSGGGILQEAGSAPRRFPPARLPGAISDRYGAGDSFAAALAFGLGRGRSAEEAVALAARCAAAVLTGRGPFEGQLGAGDL